MKAVEYLDLRGRSPFADWFSRLDATPAARVVTAITRMEQNNFTNTKSLGSGLFEYRLTFGPGYRIYFTKDGDTLIILHAGGAKRRQSQDIDAARARLQDYLERKEEI
jgi:putative addiction module killer protein